MLRGTNLALVLSIAASVLVFGALIAASHPEWFRRRQQRSTSAPVRADWDAEDEVEQPVRLVYAATPHSYPDVARHFQETVVDRAAPPLQLLSPSDQDELNDDQAEFEDDSEARRLLDQIDAMGDHEEPDEQLAEIVEPLVPEQPVESTMQQQPLWEPPRQVPVFHTARPAGMPKRRSDYKFCIGTTAGTRFEFSLNHIMLIKKSRGGKSNIIAIIMGQAHQQGIEVWYGDVSFKPVSEDGLNVNPLIKRCARVELDPTGWAQFEMLQDVVDLISKRTKQAQEEEIAYFPPVLVVFEEGKAWQDKLAGLEDTGKEEWRKLTTRCGHMLSEVSSTGAGVNVNLMILSQDAQNGTLNMTKGSVGNFGVKIFHPGLDTYSLKNLLPKGVKAEELPQPTEAQLNNPIARPWWVTYDLPSGQEGFCVLDVPRMQPMDVQRYTVNVPIPERQIRHKETPINRSTSAADLWHEQAQVSIDYPPMGQQAGPLITSAATGQVAPEPEGKPQFTARHMQVLAYLTRHRGATQSDVARAVWQRSDGPYNQRAKKYMELVLPFVPCTPADDEDFVEED